MVARCYLNTESWKRRHSDDAAGPRLHRSALVRGRRWSGFLPACGWRACRLDQIASRGAFVRRDVAGASVLIVGDGEGGARAFHNVCRHRGTRLCDTETGRFAGSIQCPYHGWTYDLQGRLIGAPQMDEVEGFAREDYPLRAVSVRGLGRPRLHQPLSVSAAAGRAARRAARRGSRRGAWANCGWCIASSTTCKANWKLIVQNYNECLHCPIIHPLLNRMHHYLGAINVPSTETYCGGAMGFKDGVETLSVDGRRRRALLPGLGPAEQQLVNYFAIYPNFLLTLHPDYMVTVTIWPQSPDRTRLVSEWHFHPDEIARPGFVYRGRGRVLGRHQSRGLGDLRAIAAGHLVARLHARPVLEPRERSCGSSISFVLSRGRDETIQASETQSLRELDWMR